MTGSVQVIASLVSAVPTLEKSFTSPGTYSWIAPSGVTSVCVVCVGAGGSGSSWYAGGGGGGLGWKNNITVVPGNSYTVVVGAGGAGKVFPYEGASGGDSYFINTSTCVGYGGVGGNYNTG
ncbi:hypothetical protein EBT25_13355, partial [bacterium]|nr:hypothetical protein [bacterium]